MNGTDATDHSDSEDSGGGWCGIALMVVPLLVLAAHFYWRDILPLKLAAVGLALAAASIPVQGLYWSIFDRSLRGAEEFSLHMGSTTFLAIVGVAVAFWWGWTGAGIVFGIYLLWSVIAGLIDGRM
jgi:hypothetical protein